MLVTFGRQTRMLLRWNPTASCGSTVVVPSRKQNGAHGDFKWKHDGKLYHFFEYNTKLGWTLQLKLDCPLRNGWQTLGIPNVRKKGLCCLHVPKKIKLFWWQIGHKVVSFREWLGKRGGRQFSHFALHLLRLWDIVCEIALNQKGTITLICLLAACEVEGTTLWSTGAWIDQSVDSWTNASNVGSWCCECTRGKITKTRFKRGFQTTSPRFWEIWMLIASFGLWYAPRGIDHGYLICDYQLPTTAVGQGS